MTTTGADIIGTVLKQAGATHVFGIPGGEVLALMQGLDAAGLRFVLVKHENAGGFMAEGLWHMTGALPVLLATLGPGVANAVNVVANAMQDRVPLVFLTGCVDAAEAKTYTHQVFDHQALLRPVVKGSFRLEAGSVSAVMAEAIALARSGQPGPVHVDVPIGVAEGLATELPLPPAPPVPPQSPDATALAAALRALAAARRPLALAGVDAVNEGLGPLITAFCRDHAIPLITTYKGKGLMDEADPLCLGGAGLSPRADAILMPLMARADCMVLIGYDPIEMRIGWRDPWRAGQTVIDLVPAPRNHGMHRAQHVLIGGLAESLTALRHAAPPRWPEGACACARGAQIGLRRPRPMGPASGLRHVARSHAARHGDHGGQRRAPDPAQPDVGLPGAAADAAILGPVHHGLCRAAGRRGEDRAATGPGSRLCRGCGAGNGRG